MARARFDNLEPSRQESILAAAGEEFAAHGYSGASLNRIIASAGMSEGALYYYVDDKSDLFASVIEVSVRTFGLRSTALMSKDAWHVRLALALGLVVEATMAADESGDRWMMERLDAYQGESFTCRGLRRIAR